MLINSPNISGSLKVTGNTVITGSLTVLGGINATITGSATTASYVEYSNVANKPALVSGSSQVTYSGLTGVPSGIVSGSSQITYSGISSIPSGIVSSSTQITGYSVFATTGSNQFNGSQAVTGSLTVTGQVVAQTLNVQQVTSSIVYSSGSNIFGNSLSNTQQFTGSLQVSGSSHYVLGSVGVGIAIPTNPLHIASNTLSQLNIQALSGNTNAQINLEPTGTGIALIGPANNVDFAFRTNATERLRITLGGNVGIGTSNPTNFASSYRTLALNGSSASVLEFKIGDTSSAYLISDGTSSSFTDLGNRFFTIGTNNTERMRITAGGLVGIGTNNPSYILHAKAASGSTTGLRLESSGGTTNFDILSSEGDGNVYLYQRSNYGILIGTNNSLRMTITAGGFVGIGTTPSYLLHIPQDNNLFLSNLFLTGTANNPRLSSGATGGSMSLEGGGAAEGKIYLQGAASGGDGYIQFIAGGTERMRLISTGFLKASNNGSYQYPTNLFHSFDTSIADWTCTITNKNVTSGNGILITYASAPNNFSSAFLYAQDNAAVRFQVYSNGGIANYQANNVNLSDERTKKDIAPLESYWDKFKAIEIVKFKYKDQTHDDYNIGVIAQQVEAIAPEFVDVDGWDKTPEDGIPLKSIYTADLHHATIKVLQECMSKIEEQQSQIEILKTKIEILEQS
jgi:hypothetical protein